MIIKSVEVENIRSYIREKIEFNDSSIMLSGDIGSGKSTILLAIEFALFGIKRGEFSGNDLLRNGEDKGSVILKFEISNDADNTTSEYVIKRTLKRSSVGIKQESGTIIQNGVASNLTPVELKAHIYKILGYPKSILSKSKDYIYRYTVYTPQEEMKKIIFEDRESRLDTLRRIFEIDKYKQIRENSYVYLRELKSRANIKKALLEDYDYLVNEEKKYSSEIAELEKKLNQLKIDEQNSLRILDENKLSFEDVKRELEEYKNLKREINVLEEKLLDKVNNISKNSLLIKNLVQEQEKDNMNLSKINIKEFTLSENDIQIGIEEMQKKITEHQLNKNILDKEITDAISSKNKKELREKEIITLNKNINEYNKNKTELLKLLESNNNIDVKLKNNEDSYQHLIINKTEISVKINNNNSKIDKVKSVDNCPYCLQHVGDEHKNNICGASEKENKILLKKLQLFENNIKSTISEIDKIKKAKLEIDNATHKINEINFKIKDFNEKIVTYKNDIEELNTSVSKLDKLTLQKEKYDNFDSNKYLNEIKLKNLLLSQIRENSKNKIRVESIKKSLMQRDVEIIRLREDNTNTKKEIGQINSKKLAINEEIKIIPELNMKVAEFEEKLNISTKDYNKIKSDIAVTINEQSLIKKNHEKLLSEIKIKDLHKSELNKLESYIKYFDDFFLNVVAVIEKNVMMKIYNEFNEYFSKWFNILIEDEVFMGRLDDEFSPVIIQNGYEVELSSLSGGEKQSIALAYRLALNKVLNDLIDGIKTKDIIILDEPTDGFSSGQLDKVRDVLLELNMKQVIIVSHDPKIESFVENVIRVNKVEHVSKVISE